MSAIVRLLTHKVSVPLKRPFITAVRRADAVELALVEAVDEDGRSGWGEAATSWKVTGESPESVAAAVVDPLGDAVLGHEPDDPALPGLIARAIWGNVAARSAVETAVLDLRAQAAGMSMVTLLKVMATDAATSPDEIALMSSVLTERKGSRNGQGNEHIAQMRPALGASSGEDSSTLRRSRRTRAVRTDMTLSAGDPEELARIAAGHVEDGFDHIKIKASRDRDAFAAVSAVRRAVGDEVVLRVDANQAWTPGEAIAFIQKSEDAGLGLEFVEQPVAFYDLAGMAKAKAASHTPIVADESVRVARDVRELAERGACDQINVKLAKTGGLCEALAVAGATRKAGMGILVGCMMEGPIGVSASAALAAVVSPDRVHDLDAALWLAETPVAGGARFVDEAVELDEGPGLGVRGLRGNP